MPVSLFLISSLALIFSVCVFAVTKGGPAERYAGIVVAVSTIGVEVIHLTVSREVQGSLLLAMDGFVGGAFLLLALRYASLWLGGALLLQAIQFSLHAYYFVTGIRRGNTYALINNLDSAGVLLCILVGSLIAWRRRAAGK
ncbi:hypothetical protein [Caulobacter segnis]|uniref:hypothetical protein n=1 Tax=Caulobacter segnis TaxID=88688 RepID=UPI0028630E87|nr:hypothetical protein [Caulobacter segnis]MDR6627552.1 hypothetical protein [Caulobacter segnis]